MIKVPYLWLLLVSKDPVALNICSAEIYNMLKTRGGSREKSWEGGPLDQGRQYDSSVMIGGSR